MRARVKTDRGTPAVARQPDTLGRARDRISQILHLPSRLSRELTIDKSTGCSIIYSLIFKIGELRLSKRCCNMEISLWGDNIPYLDVGADTPNSMTTYFLDTDKPLACIVVLPGGGYSERAPHEASRSRNSSTRAECTPPSSTTASRRTAIPRRSPTRSARSSCCARGRMSGKSIRIR